MNFDHIYSDFFPLLLFIVIIFFLINKYVNHLNYKKLDEPLPKSIKDIYDSEKYSKFVKYSKTKYFFNSALENFNFMIIFLALYLGLFGLLDEKLGIFLHDGILKSLVFLGIIALIQMILSLPFSYYDTFRIESDFGFNKMTKKIFWSDFIKGIFIALIIYGLLGSTIIWLYEKYDTNFWWMAWVVISVFSIFFSMFYTSIIVPLFNKQTPLAGGELRSAINTFARKVGFKLDEIYVLDSSTRSTKGNRYFSGLGPKKRIVLFDTLIKELSTEQMVGVLAHEIGHYKKKHTLEMIIYSILQVGIILYIFSLVIDDRLLAIALGATNPSFHIGLVAFMILFIPLNFILGIISNIFIRKNEYEADKYAKDNYDADALIGALKELSKQNLGNLTPHPLYEFIHYSHPSVPKRIERLSANK